MKAKHKIRALRALAIAGSLSALALPSAAVARPDAMGPVGHSGVAQSPSTFPKANFHSEVQQRPQKPYTLPSGFKPEVQTPPAPTQAPVSSVVREIRTVDQNSGRTLAIVLASIALAIALCSTAYAGVRLTRMQRRLPGSAH